jgi:excisionase family DNA binding protein
MVSDDSRKVLYRLREELAAADREREVAALDELLADMGETVDVATDSVYLQLRKRWYTPAEVAERVGVSRQTVVKWIERGELDADVTPGGHHRIPASAFTTRRRGARADLRLVPTRPTRR